MRSFPTDGDSRIQADFRFRDLGKPLGRHNSTSLNWILRSLANIDSIMSKITEPIIKNIFLMSLRAKVFLVCVGLPVGVCQPVIHLGGDACRYPFAHAGLWFIIHGPPFLSSFAIDRRDRLGANNRSGKGRLKAPAEADIWLDIADQHRPLCLFTFSIGAIDRQFLLRSRLTAVVQVMGLQFLALTPSGR